MINNAQRFAIAIMLLAFGGMISSCSSKERPVVNTFFSIQEFINHQLELVHSADVNLVKTVKFGTETEELKLSNIDSAQWEKELGIFRKHDINKPVLIDAYSTLQDETASGDKRTTYQLIEPDDGILDMEVVFGSDNQVMSWSSSFTEGNLLYSNYREVALTTDTDGRLKSYHIEGYHKLLFKDTVYYHLNAEVFFQ